MFQADLKNVIEAGIERVFAIVFFHISCDEGAAPADDPQFPFEGGGNMCCQQTCVDRHVVHSLFRLIADRLQDRFPVEGIGTVLRHDLIDRDRAEGNGACFDDDGPDEVDVPPGTQVHDGIRAVLHRLCQFPFFRLRTARQRGGADIGVDLGGEFPADPDRTQVFVVDVRRNDDPAVRDPFEDEFFASAFCCRHTGDLRCDDPLLCCKTLGEWCVL